MPISESGWDSVLQEAKEAGIPVILVDRMVNVEDESLYDGNTLVKINQGGKIGEFVTVGVPFTISDYQPTYGPCPTLGGNTTEVLTELGYTPEQIDSFAKNGTTTPMPKEAAK